MNLLYGLFPEVLESSGADAVDWADDSKFELPAGSVDNPSYGSEFIDNFNAYHTTYGNEPERMIRGLIPSQTNLWGAYVNFMARDVFCRNGGSLVLTPVESELKSLKRVIPSGSWVYFGIRFYLQERGLRCMSCGRSARALHVFKHPDSGQQLYLSSGCAARLFGVSRRVLDLAMNVVPLFERDLSYYFIVQGKGCMRQYAEYLMGRLGQVFIRGGVAALIHLSEFDVVFGQSKSLSNKDNIYCKFATGTMEHRSVDWVASHSALCANAKYEGGRLVPRVSEERIQDYLIVAREFAARNIPIPFSLCARINDVISHRLSLKQVAGSRGTSRSARSKEKGNVLNHGLCGEQITWTFYDSGLLVLSGSGEMDSWCQGPNAVASVPPWSEYFESITEVEVKGDMSNIGGYAFCGCTSLRKVTLANDIVILGPSSFWGCAQLKEIKFPMSLSSISEDAFYGCSGLKELVLPKGLQHIGTSVFSYCTGLTSVALPGDLITIGDRAFEGCSSLKEVLWGKKVAKIGEGAFIACTRLASVLLPESVTSVGKSAFLRLSPYSSVATWNSDLLKAYVHYDPALTHVSGYTVMGGRV